MEIGIKAVNKEIMMYCKMIKKISIALVPMAGLLISSVANSASVATNGTAVIIAPIAIVKTADLSFGDIVPGAVAGTVTLGLADTITGFASVTLAGGTVTSGAFTVSGEPNKAYTLTLPGAAVTLNDGGGNTMTMDTFNDNSPGALDLSGNAAFNVGAILNVGAGQIAGTYTGSFNVDVVY